MSDKVVVSDLVLYHHQGYHDVMTMRAGLYLRKSTVPGEENRSLELQESTCRQIAEQNRYTVVETYSQIVSGWDPRAKRTEFARMLEDIEAGRLDVIVCYRIDRLGRLLNQTAALLTLCKEKNVLIAHSGGIVDPNNASQSLLFNIISAIAENESATISERVTNDRRARRYESWLGGNVPYGYMPGERDERNNRILVPHPEESRCVWRMYELVVVENRTATHAAEVLSAEGFRTRSGGYWTMKRIQQVLCSPVNAGYAVGTPGGPRHRPGQQPEIVYKDGKPHMLHQGILTPEQWEEAKAAIGAKPLKTARKQRRSPFLSGLVFCGVCGSKMVAGYSSRQGRVYRRYQCPGYSLPKPNRCSNGFSNIPLETFAVDYTRVTLKDPKFRAALDRRARKADDPRAQFELLQRSDGLKDAEEAVQEQLMATLNPRTISVLSERLAQINDEQITVAEELGRTRRNAEIAYSVEDIHHAVESMDPGDRRYAVESVIEKIMIEPGERMFIKGVMGGATVDLSRIRIKRKYSRSWDQINTPTPAPLPTEIECSRCHEMVDRTDFIRLHSKSCSDDSESSS